MCGHFAHVFHRPPMRMGCCGPWAWREPSKEEKLAWLKSYKENLEKELAEIQKEMDRMRQEV